MRFQVRLSISDAIPYQAPPIYARNKNFQKNFNLTSYRYRYLFRKSKLITLTSVNVKDMERYGTGTEPATLGTGYYGTGTAQTSALSTLHSDLCVRILGLRVTVK